jgi:hypothetical protein
LFPDETTFHKLCENFTFDDIVFRSDFLFRNKEIKLIEINSGASIGGWELDFFHNSLFPLYELEPSKYRYIGTINTFFEYLSDAILKKNISDFTGNVLFVFDSEEENKEFEWMLDSYYKSSSKYISGDVKCIGRKYLLEAMSKNKIIIDGVKVDAIFNFSYEGNLSNRELNELWEKGAGLYSENDVLKFIGSKSFLALMHEPLILKSLSSREQDWIKNHVPYTVSLATYTTENHCSIDLLSMKNDFVIKKSFSLQGQHVFIGKDLSMDRWKEILIKLNSNKEWVAQKFCSPNTEYISNPDGEMRKSFVIWAAFNFGGKFGGAFIRSLPLNKGSHLINAAKGAFLNLVYEKCYFSGG